MSEPKYFSIEVTVTRCENCPRHEGRWGLCLEVNGDTPEDEARQSEVYLQNWNGITHTCPLWQANQPKE